MEIASFRWPSSQPLGFQAKHGVVSCFRGKRTADLQFRRQLQASHSNNSVEFVGFTLIVDDIVFSNGITQMGVLGGGGPQTLFGYQLCRNQEGIVGLAAGVGQDLPDHCRNWLQQVGCDLSGLLYCDLPTPRAWQLLEGDGRRTQVWRTTPCPALYDMLRPAFSQLPPSFRSAPSFSIGVHPQRPPLDLLAHLKQAAQDNGGLLAVEPFVWSERVLTQEELRCLVSTSNLFSPNELEAQSMLGIHDPLHILQELAGAGADIVALRRGESGSMLLQCSTGEVWNVPPAVPTQVVDPTGCGNAFVGALVASLSRGDSLAEGGVWGAVAASFMIEEHGVPSRPPRELRAEAQLRADQLRPQVTSLPLNARP